MSSRVCIVIFGASGDLTARKLVPALYMNFKKGRLPEGAVIIGFSRTKLTDEGFREKMREALQEFTPHEYSAQAWDSFAERLFYHPGDMSVTEAYPPLYARMHELAGPSCSALYYLATSPEFFPVGITCLHAAGMATEARDGSGGYRRVIIEKPFGKDLASAHELNRATHEVFDERQVYRIDHYLGKETVQNILVFRFGNSIFEPIWNRNFVDHIQITVAEEVGVGHRAGYYDTSGVMRDMFQNHILQLLTLIAMEPPIHYEADALRNEKVKVLSAIRPMQADDIRKNTVRAQYEGYCNEPGVAANSKTPTYAALKLFIDNWRWQGVPFYLRSGKHLREKVSEVTVQFRRPPHTLFSVPLDRDNPEVNRLSLRIQPNEGIHLRFATKVPDQGMAMQPVDMDFHYRDSFGNGAIPEAYERLTLDALKGDASLFARSDEIELAWRFIDSIHTQWNADQTKPPVLIYRRGSEGPSEADDLLGRDDRAWYLTSRPAWYRVRFYNE